MKIDNQVQIMKNIPRRMFCLFLTFVMTVSVFALDWSGFVQLVPTVEAAEGANNYTWSVRVKVSDDIDAMDDNTYMNVDFMTLNGQGEKYTLKICGCSFAEGNDDETWKSSSYSVPAGYFPYNLYWYVDCKYGNAASWSADFWFTTPAGTWSKHDGTDGDHGTSMISGNYSDYSGSRPYVSSINFGATPDVDITSKNGTSSNVSYTATEIKDQWGVKWQKTDNFTWWSYSDGHSSYVSGDYSTTGKCKYIPVNVNTTIIMVRIIRVNFN